MMNRGESFRKIINLSKAGKLQNFGAKCCKIRKI